MSNPTAAVAAGLLEECGGLSMQPSQQGLVPVVCIARTGQDPDLTGLHSRWGGIVEQTRPGEQGLRRWLLAGPATEPFLRWVSGHLWTMAERAELALRASATTDPEDLAAISDRMMAINRLVDDPAPTEPFVARLVGKTAWEVPQMNLFGSGPSESFSGTWPRSGSMRGGVCYERTMSVRPIGEHAGSVLRTPLASLGDGSGGMSPELRRQRGQGPSLADEVEYLMTDRRATG